MISRRIWESVAVTWISLLSPWRGRHHHARQADTSQFSKKAGGEAGGTSPPFNLPTEGGVFHRKVTEGASFSPAPRREPSAGATNAGDTLHLVERSTPGFNPLPGARRQSAIPRRS